MLVRDKAYQAWGPNYVQYELERYKDRIMTPPRDRSFRVYRAVRAAGSLLSGMDRAGHAVENPLKHKGK